MDREAKDREQDALRDLETRRNKLMKKGLVEREEDIAEVEKVMFRKALLTTNRQQSIGTG